MSESAGSASWPRSVFDAPPLRGLDEHAAGELMRAGRLSTYQAGSVVYNAGDASDAFFVLVSGRITLSALRRGDEAASEVRRVRRGETFGEEAALAGAERRTTAAVDEDSQIAEIPINVFWRVAAKSGAGEVAEREQRALMRAATRDLLHTLAFTSELSDADVDLLLDAVRHQTFGRAQRIYAAGDRSTGCYLIADGLVQLQTDEDERVHVRAYLSRGDFFGDEELLHSERRRLSAVALGDCRCLFVPADVLSTIADRNPGLLARLRRLRADRQELQESLVGQAASRTTQHVFKDLYRMQMARALLAIDQDTCVRCGHCAWACAELYGVARLVRRGDKILTELEQPAPSGGAHQLMLPNSCQHCRNPACMIDCPTGAIGRDPEGEVFIREELCTGCAACAKACPWENIQMAPRLLDLTQKKPAALRLSSEVAVKCDLCREYEAPACVQACPTESIFRLEPLADVAEVKRLLGGGSEGQAVERRAPDPFAWLVSVCLGLGVALGVSGWVLSSRGVWVPARGAGYAAGLAAALAVLLLAGYSAPKRLVRLWMTPRRRESAARRAADAGASVRKRPRSRVRPFTLAHVALGSLAMAAVLAHAGPRLGGNAAGALAIAFWFAALLGVYGAVVYRWLPTRLARLERRGALPEDLSNERELLFDRLYRDASGRNELVKKLMEKQLLPYARSFFGPFSLLLSGNSLKQEEQRLSEQITTLLQGRGKDKLDGLDALIRTVVELRALPLRRSLSLSLRGWLPLHILATGVVLALLFVHVLSVTRF